MGKLTGVNNDRGALSDTQLTLLHEWSNTDFRGKNIRVMLSQQPQQAQ